MKVSSDNNTSQHYKTSSNSSQDASLISGLIKLKSKHIIKSFDSRGGHASSSNKSGNVPSYGGAGTGSGGAGHKRYKSSAGSSNCHSSFSNERSKFTRIFGNILYHQIQDGSPTNAIFLPLNGLIMTFDCRKIIRRGSAKYICLLRQSSRHERGERKRGRRCNFRGSKYAF